ncbi:MAG: tRNA (adenosine(37)-N6)-threonylcarbamoyltransferase complex dimerization subunit type 1 TsaB, partial [Actinobacteria bacterium]|nr:tRNA (adenosine(37)-N6)-threonylcarbamoyltransferase complex dimerization subunit type 1 TsaB [Actinomycetota bacterium]
AGGLMLVLGIETSTPQTSIAVGTEQGLLAGMIVSRARGGDEVVSPAIRHVLDLAEVEPGRLAGIAVGLGPGLFTGMRVGISAARGLAQVLRLPIVGMGSLDVLAFGVRYSRRLICAVTDARRAEVFYAMYRPMQGGVARESEYLVGSSARLVAEIEAKGEEVLLVGGGALVYRRDLEVLGSQVEFASAGHAFPGAAALVELAVPRFMREQTDRFADVVPYYVRKSDAEIAWDRRTRSA